MADVTKFAVKNLNLPLLLEQIVTAGLTQRGLLLAGFLNTASDQYTPLAARTEIGRSGNVSDFADPGELRFTFGRALTPAEDTALDGVLTAHVSTVRTTDQQNKQTDRDSVDPFVANHRNWNTLTDVEKDDNAREVTRAVARLLDSSQDL